MSSRAMLARVHGLGHEQEGHDLGDGGWGPALGLALGVEHSAGLPLYEHGGGRGDLRRGGVLCREAARAGAASRAQSQDAGPELCAVFFIFERPPKAGFCKTLCGLVRTNALPAGR